MVEHSQGGNSSAVTENAGNEQTWREDNIFHFSSFPVSALGLRSKNLHMRSILFLLMCVYGPGALVRMSDEWEIGFTISRAPEHSSSVRVEGI